MKLKIFKKKLHSLIERIRLSEPEFEIMKAQSKSYEAVCSAVEVNFSSKHRDITDNVGAIIDKIYISKDFNIDVDIKKILSSMGIIVDSSDKVNVIQ
jgi:hypothetical protein